MIIIPELEQVVIQPPRTGSTSLKTVLLDAFPLATNPHRHMERVGIPDEFKNYEIVGIVRHPYERLYSLWKYMRYLKLDVAHSENHQRWADRIRKDADRPFEEWLLNSDDPFADMGGPGMTCDSEYYRTANPYSAAKKSQFDYLRPDLGPVTVLKLEEGLIGDFFGVTLPTLNRSRVMHHARPTSDTIYHFLRQHHSWDLSLYWRDNMNWKNQSRIALAQVVSVMPLGRKVTSDILRRAVELRTGLPDHPNAWGGLFRFAQKEGILSATGKYISSRRRESNARKIPEYETSGLKARNYLTGAQSKFAVAA